MHVVVNAGKLGSASMGLPSEHEISTGFSDSELKLKVQLSHDVWPSKSGGTANPRRTNKRGTNLMVECDLAKGVLARPTSAIHNIIKITEST